MTICKKYTIISFLVSQLKYFIATALPNNSLLLEWEVKFDGGHPIEEFHITIEGQVPRQRRQAPHFLSFDLSPEQVNAGRHVTEAVESGREYTVTARVQNELGTREDGVNGKHACMRMHNTLDAALTTTYY